MDSKIKNVVFDLGGVLINLDFDNCLNAFRKAGFRDIEKQACQFRGKGFFSQFELGEITGNSVSAVTSSNKASAAFKVTFNSAAFASNACAIFALRAAKSTITLPSSNKACS